MKVFLVYIFFLLSASTVVTSFATNDSERQTLIYYDNQLESLLGNARILLQKLDRLDLSKESERSQFRRILLDGRLKVKSLDFFLRYFDPVQYKKINGPLPVEWETEVFEKFERPYKRIGAGYTLALQYLDESEVSNDTLRYMLAPAVEAIQSFSADSNTRNFQSFDHFYFCNRLFLLNLAAIYTTGFDCPDDEAVIPELTYMLSNVLEIYRAYNKDFPEQSLPQRYLDLFVKTVQFCENQPPLIDSFDHFTFIRDFVSPLFSQNQELIRLYHAKSTSNNDYSLNKEARSLFSKNLYYAQNTRGVFLRVKDSAALAEIDRLGKMLFYDPLLSGNNKRSCVSCHKPMEAFTDTTTSTPIDFNNTHLLPRNAPSLLNVVPNHLIMADGKHLSLLDQTKAVIQNSNEMGSSLNDLMKKIRSCGEYDKAFKRLLKYTPAYDNVDIDHIASAITFYYGKFSDLSSSFDSAMNWLKEVTPEQRSGFNIFMGKAKCGTCHFVPLFNGVKPPYVGSEFEVLGVPEDSAYRAISDDIGRYAVNPAWETLHAFRTGTVRNSARTGPYMHNGVFSSLEQVIDFYDSGGGRGRKFDIPNQTLDSDSLHLTSVEKRELIAFMQSLTEGYSPEAPPFKLPTSSIYKLNKRKVGGEY